MRVNPSASLFATVLLAAGMICALPAPGRSQQTRPARPNILLILADDLGPEWLSCYGSECHTTPQIDRLAESGVRFTTAWATPLCTPTRVEMLTGRYPFRTGWVRHHDAPRWGGQYFDWKREITFARALRDAGYATVIAGKWQINDLRVQPDALREHGFDEHCVWPGYETGNPPSEARYMDPYIQENGERAIRKGEFGPDVFRAFLTSYMERHRQGPFLAYYAMPLPHPPLTPTPLTKEGETDRRDLLTGMISYVDREVGQLVEAVDRLGIRERTVIIFATDNGCNVGTKCQAWGRTVVGAKGKLLETGIHVPVIVSWPGMTPRNKVSDRLIDFSDIFPTLLDLAGVAPPENVTIDGHSFADLLRGKDTGTERAWIFSQLDPRRVIRDERFKLWSDGQFYDLKNDPAESKDLASSREPAHVAAKSRLQAVLDSLPADTTLPFERSGPPARPE